MQLKLVNINDIAVEDRIRADLGDIEGLVTSFKDSGIIQPLAVVALDTKGKYRLLAGGRRMSAAKLAKIEEVPVRIYSKGLTELEIKSIELSENIFRKDLTWQEQVDIESQIYELETKIHGKKTSTAEGAPGVSRTDVARLLGKSSTAFREDLTLNTFAKQIPELAQQKTKADAKKLLKQLKQKMADTEKVKIIKGMKKDTSADKQRQQLVNSYVLMDFFKGVNKVPSGTIDLVEIDPPYGIDLKDMKKLEGNAKTTVNDYNEVKADKYFAFMVKTLVESYRVLKDNGWLILWFGPEPWFEPMFKIATELGYKGMRLPAIWLKGSGQTMQPDYYMPNSYEMFFYFRKGSPALHHKGRANIFDFTPLNSSVKIHPTERPLTLMEDILETFVSPGSSVMVPFLGSGNTLLACDNLDMVGFGYDLTKSYKDKFTIRVYDQLPGMYAL